MGATRHRAIRESTTSSSRAEDRNGRAVDEPAAIAEPATFTAKLVALDERGQAWIAADEEGMVPGRRRLPGRPPEEPVRVAPRAARTTVPLAPEHVGREVLACRANRTGEAVIMGLLIDAAGTESVEESALDLVIERRRVILAAKTEVVLRCGQGSITLAADGKVTIRGIDVVSSASRTQRIRGGAVRIN